MEEETRKMAKIGADQAKTTSMMSHVMYTLSQPVELSCGSLICSECCCSWMRLSQRLDCPCCYNHQLSRDTVRSPNPVILSLLDKLHDQHDPQITVETILTTPSTTPTSQIEKRVATSLVKRLLKESDSSVIKVPTKGKVQSQQYLHN